VPAAPFFPLPLAKKSASSIVDRAKLAHVAVLRASDTLDVVSVNKLGESVRATPAIAGDALYVRSAAHLWAFGEKQPARP